MKGKFKLFGRIGLALFLVSVMVLTLSPVAQAATAVTEVWVEFPSTDETGSIDDSLYFNKSDSLLLWRIHFTPTTTLKAGLDTVTIQFYDGLDSTMGPTSTQDTYDVEIGGSASTATNYDIDPDGPSSTYGYYDCRTVSAGGYRITVTVPCDIDAGQEAWLLIDDASGMVTSGGPNNTSGNTTAYKVKVHTSKDTTPVLSNGFYHGANDVTFSSVTVSPSTAGSDAQYTFTFTPSADEALTANTDTVTVTFPQGTTVPSSISASNITVYDGTGSTWYTCGTDAVIDTDLRTVKVTVPYTLAASTSHKVRFATAAGIKNPTYAQTDYGENDVDAANQIGFIRTSQEQLDIALADGSGYTINEDTAATLDFDYSASPTLVTGLSDKYTMINMYSSVLYLQVEDQYGNLCDTGDTASAQVTLSSSSGTGNFYYDGGTSYTQITGTQTLSSGAKEIYYRDSTAGTHTLTASYSGLTSATWTMTVCPGVGLYDRYDNLVHTYAPTSSDPVEESDKTSLTEYKGGYYLDQAIEAATAYDQVVMGDGAYEVDSSTNEVKLDEAYVTLKSLNGADNTIYDASAGISNMLDCTAANVTIDGITFKGLVTSNSQRGVYLRYGGFTVQNCKFVDIPNDNICLFPSAAITSGTITNNTLTGLGPGSEAYRNGIIAEDYGYAISGVTISNNTISGFNGYRSNGIGVAKSSSGSATVTITGNTVTDCYWGLHYYGAVTGMTNDYATTGNTFSQCVTGVAIEPHSTNANSAFNLVNNDISNNNLYGIYVLSATANMEGTKDIRYNDLSGNGSFGILNAAASTTTNPVAKYNWWGDVTGPGAGTGAYASTTAQGSGDAVSVYVDYEPWLHQTRATVVADNASYQAANMKLVAGWNTLSTPVKLDTSADTIDELIPTGMTIGYYYDGGWQQITTGYVLNPCDAVYVKMSAITYVLLKFDAGAWTTPSKALDVGWNLVSLAYLSSSGMNDAPAVASVYSTAAGLPGYSQVVSPSLNDAQTDLYGSTSPSSWTYSRDQTTGAGTNTMYAGLGYWVYMQNAATLAGFTITPIVPDLD